MGCVLRNPVVWWLLTLELHSSACGCRLIGKILNFSDALGSIPTFRQANRCATSPCHWDVSDAPGSIPTLSGAVCSANRWSMVGEAEVAEPGVGGAAGEVGEVAAVGVGFALEGDVDVGGVQAAVLEEAEEPLDDVEEIEGDEEEFALLGGVDALVVDDVAVDPRGVAGPHRAEEVEADAAWHQRTSDYDGSTHGCLNIGLQEKQTGRPSG